MAGKPIGDRAMTATERQRRWRAKKRAGQPAATVAQLKLRLRELEAECAALRVEVEKLGAQVIRFMRAWAGSWTLNKARVHELETERAAREVPPDVADLPMTAKNMRSCAAGWSANSRAASGRRPTGC
jgi:hypothetical protein